MSVIEAGISKLGGGSVEEDRGKRHEERVADHNLVRGLGLRVNFFLRNENFFVTNEELDIFDRQTPVAMSAIFDFKDGKLAVGRGAEGSSAKDEFVVLLVLGEVKGNGFSVDVSLALLLPKVARSFLNSLVGDFFNDVGTQSNPRASEVFTLTNSNLGDENGEVVASGATSICRVS